MISQNSSVTHFRIDPPEKGVRNGSSWKPLHDTVLKRYRVLADRTIGHVSSHHPVSEFETVFPAEFRGFTLGRILENSEV